jgi:hypothetical protein
MKNAKWIALGLMSTLAACSHTPKVEEVEVEKPEFKVSEAAPGGREMWLDNAHDYAQEMGEKRGFDTEKNYYYSGEGKSASKRLACEKAHADVVDDVSKKVAVFVDSSVARAANESTSESTSGATANGSVNEEVQRISSQLSKASLHGISLKKKYWEKRDYSQAGGAKSTYFCWVLAEVDKKDVESMVQRAKTLRLQDADLKKKVSDKLGNLASEYDEYQKTHQ